MSHQTLELRLDPPTLFIERSPWTFQFIDDELVDIGWHGIRLLQGIRVVVRDEDWRTVPTRVGTVDTVESDAGIEMRAAIDASGFGIDYSIDLRVGLTSDAVEIAFTGTAQSEFRSNRIGLVALHPREAQGSRVVVEHTDGSRDDTAFPISISPHQPFVDIAALRWAIEGVDARIEFHGDVFETEDQRNWTDASFKTYSRPLELPFPFDVDEGDTISQSISISAKREVPTVRSTPLAGSVWAGEATSRRIPEISTAVGAGSDEGEGFSDVLLAEVDLTLTTWPEDLELAVRVARSHEAQLDLRLVVDDPNDLFNAEHALGEVSLARLAAFDKGSHMTEATNFETMSTLRDRIGQPVGLLAGTRAHFTELNRSHERLTEVIDRADGVTFSMTPQMHATELRHIVSSLGAQEDAVRSAAEIARGRPLHIGPITMECRFNAVATTEAGGRDFPDRDPLVRTSFAAAWLLGSVAAMAVDMIGSLTYFHLDELVGTQTAALLRALAELRGAEVVELGPSVPPDVAVVPIQKPVGIDVFVGNLTGRRRRVEIECAAGSPHLVDLTEWALGRFDCSHTV